MPATPELLSSYLAEAAEAHVRNPPGTGSNRELQPSSLPLHGPGPEAPDKEYVSKIGILASSMPYYHNQYMEKRKANLRRNEGERLEPHDLGHETNLSLDEHPREQSTEEQAANARRLKPHSRSTVQLQHITSKAAKNMEGNPQADKKKGKTTRWQFGIRSRNQPLDAMLCIYKALKAQGAQWQVAPPDSATKQEPGPYPVNATGATQIPSADARLSESPEKERYRRPRDGGHLANDYFPDMDLDDSHLYPLTPVGRHGEDSDDDYVDPAIFPESYLPKDPWCIHVRWRKDGLYPPGSLQATSAHSSMIDLNLAEQQELARRRGSMIGSMNSATGSVTSIDAAGGAVAVTPTNSCYVYMDVQLYMLETDCYLVDFKCAGYENIVEAIVNDFENDMVGSGFRVADKDVTSPQPFLDLTNRLVIHLARG